MPDITAKQRNFVSRVIAASQSVVDAHSELSELVQEYHALDYDSQLVVAAFDGNNSHIDASDIIQLGITHAALEALLDDGHRTNLLTMRG